MTIFFSVYTRENILANVPLPSSWRSLRILFKLDHSGGVVANACWHHHGLISRKYDDCPIFGDPEENVVSFRKCRHWWVLLQAKVQTELTPYDLPWSFAADAS